MGGCWHPHLVGYPPENLRVVMGRTCDVEGSVEERKLIDCACQLTGGVAYALDCLVYSVFI